MVGSSSFARFGHVTFGLCLGLVGCARGTDFLTDEVSALRPPEHAAPAVEAASDDEPPPGPPGAGSGFADGVYPPGLVATLATDAIDDAHTTVLLYGSTSTSSEAQAKLYVPTPPGGIASLVFDGKRRLYVLDYSGRIQVFASGATGLATPTRVVNPNGLFTASDVTGAEDLAIDADGRLYVAIATQLAEDGPNGVLVFDADATGTAAPTRFIRGPHTGMRLPIEMDFDAAGHLFVGDYDAMEVLVFASDADGDAAPLRVACVTEGLGSMAVSPEGRVYVSPEGTPEWSVRVYAPIDGTSQKLEGVLHGPHTGLDQAFGWPIKMSIDPALGLVTVSPLGVLRYGREAVGDEAPTSHFDGWNDVAVAPR